MGSSRESGSSMVEALVERYSQLRTYRDEGVVLRPSPLTEIQFRTAYSEPNLFRFEFDSTHPFPELKHLVTKHVVGCDGSRAYSHETRTGVDGALRIMGDVGMAVAGATGISGGSAHTIARLLLPSVRGLALTDLRDWAIGGEVVVDDVACHRLVGLHPRVGGQWEVAVDKALLLMRSVAYDLDDHERQLQVRRRISVDEEIDPSAFAVPE